MRTRKLCVIAAFLLCAGGALTQRSDFWMDENTGTGESRKSVLGLTYSVSKIKSAEAFLLIDKMALPASPMVYQFIESRCFGLLHYMTATVCPRSDMAYIVNLYIAILPRREAEIIDAARPFIVKEDDEGMRSELESRFGPLSP
jgi:hypothetical protein